MNFPESDIESIEKSIAALTNSDDLELTIPDVMTGATSCCSEAALLQFVVTWARTKGAVSTAKFSSLDSQSSQIEEDIRKHLSFPYILAAWVLAGKLVDANGSVLRRRDARSYAEFLDAMDDFQFQATHQTPESRANLVCIQGGKREFIRPFYEEDRGGVRVKREGDIRIIVQDILMQLAPNWAVSYVREITESLAHLVRELVENSDWWARFDHRGVEYSKGLRAVTFRLIEIDQDNANVFSGANSHLKAYLLHNLTTHEKVRGEAPSSYQGEVRKLSFVELSMVDSGPGLARRWLANRPENKQSIDRLSEITLEEEEYAVVECFKKWRTSSGNSLRGVGLFSIASLLRKRNGFLRLRTGRLAFLFGTESAINVIESQLKKYKNLEDYVRLEDGTHVFLQDGSMIFFLKPWSQDKSGIAEGTAYSILLPV